MTLPIMPPMLPQPAKPARRFIKWGDYMICEQCRMAAQYCACDRAPADAPPPDGALSSLEKRARDVKRR